MEHKGEFKAPPGGLSTVESKTVGTAGASSTGSLAPVVEDDAFHAPEIFSDIKSLTSLGLVCPVCQNVARSVTESHAAGCGHMFCADCITKVVQMKPECPCCRAPLKQSDLKRSQALQRIIDDAMVRCPSPAALCKWQGRRGDVKQHVLERCEFAVVRCAGCGSQHRRSETAAHQNVCPRRQVPCPYCKSPVVFELGRLHLQEDCFQNPETMTVKVGDLNRLKAMLKQATEAHRKEVEAHQQTKKFATLVFEIGDVIDVKAAQTENWFAGEIVGVSKLGDSYLVHFSGFPSEQDEWIPRTRKERFAPANTRSRGSVATATASTAAGAGAGSGSGGAGAAGAGAGSGTGSDADSRAIKKRKLDQPVGPPCSV